MFSSVISTHHSIFLVLFIVADSSTGILSFSFPDLFGLQPIKPIKSSSNALLEESTNNVVIADAFVYYTSTNIRGGNSKFKYIPPKNYREIFIYQWTDFAGQLKNLELMSHLMPKRLQKRNAIPSSDLEKLQALELAAMQKGVVAVCKWAIPFPSNPLGRIEHCTQAELESVLNRG